MVCDRCCIGFGFTNSSTGPLFAVSAEENYLGPDDSVSYLFSGQGIGGFVDSEGIRFCHDADCRMECYNSTKWATCSKVLNCVFGIKLCIIDHISRVQPHGTNLLITVTPVTSALGVSSIACHHFTVFFFLL